MASQLTERFRIIEHTTTNQTTTVIGTRSEDGQDRIDIIHPEGGQNHVRHYFRYLVDMFLPAGYPGSVTEDYTAYQFYDSIQAMMSTIAGLLADRAVLQGIGIGDATASTTTAIILGVVRGSLGRLTTIAFAHRFGTVLEPECKMFRLFADVVNDAAIILECASLAFSKPIRVGVLSLATCMRSLCGVAAGSTKACLSAHFAKKGNLADVNAKDDSQETAINLIAMWIGTLFISKVESQQAVWSWLVLLLSMHLACNHRAVRSVVITYLNRQRANIVFSHWLTHGKVLTPKEVAARERIFDTGVMRDGDHVLGSCKIGVSFQELLSEVRTCCSRTGETKSASWVCRDLLEICDASKAPYLFWADEDAARGCIALKEGCTPEMQVMAWYTVFRALRNPEPLGSKTPTDLAQRLRLCHSAAKKDFVRLQEELKKAGWNVAESALQTSERATIEWKLGE